jgi:hypothetical protein
MVKPVSANNGLLNATRYQLSVNKWRAGTTLHLRVQPGIILSYGFMIIMIRHRRRSLSCVPEKKSFLGGIF